MVPLFLFLSVDPSCGAFSWQRVEQEEETNTGTQGYKLGIDGLILEKHVPTHEPWLLQHHCNHLLHRDEWYYSVNREKVPKGKSVRRVFVKVIPMVVGGKPTTGTSPFTKET